MAPWQMILVLGAMALITWGPTLLAFRRRRKRGEPVLLRHLVAALFLEGVVLVGLAAIANVAGLSDPGSYLLVIALLVGAAGAQIFSSMRFKPSAAD